MPPVQYMATVLPAQAPRGLLTRRPGSRRKCATPGRWRPKGRAPPKLPGVDDDGVGVVEQRAPLLGRDMCRDHPAGADAPTPKPRPGLDVDLEQGEGRRAQSLCLEVQAGERAPCRSSGVLEGGEHLGRRGHRSTQAFGRDGDIARVRPCGPQVRNCLGHGLRVGQGDEAGRTRRGGTGAWREIVPRLPRRCAPSTPGRQCARPPCPGWGQSPQAPSPGPRLRGSSSRAGWLNREVPPQPHRFAVAARRR